MALDRIREPSDLRALSYPELADLAELEPLLAAVRETGAGLEDMELRRADLEQVFLHLTEAA